MIRLVEALNYRCLRYVSQRLDDFHVLVGPNASGKTTFLDALAFLGDLVSEGLEKAISERTQDFRDMVWRRTDGRIELAVELEIPNERRKLLERQTWSLVRYEVAVGTDPQSGEVGILEEKVLLKPPEGRSPMQRTLFPAEPTAPETLISPKTTRGTKTIVNKVAGGNDNFYDETGRGWDHAFKLGPRRSALANLPEDESKFPVATWLKGVLMEGVQRLILNSTLMRNPSPPGQPRKFRPDGANLPWVIERLKTDDPAKHAEWVSHVRTALPDIEDVKTIERPEDRSRYLVICYRDKLEVPSWTASDGTLRLLALTLIAYLSKLTGVYLIEEPENGVHPRAVETVFQSLSSVYDAQILLATHSPVILSIAEPSQILCFSKVESGAADIIRGTEHPALRDWRGESNLGVLFAGGVLG
ncbi:MAG TPA: ATP-binding protein [Phycisphaerae bacterium]|nr:ATP-binding protein [Phycisphaerae bacterium]